MNALPQGDSATPIRWYRRLLSARGRQEAGLFLVEGPRAIAHICHAASSRIREIMLAPDAVFEQPPGVSTRRISAKKLEALCTTRHSQGAVAVVTLPPGSYSSKPPAQPGTKILLLEDVQDPGNVGTLIRTAAAFDFDGVLLTEKCADPFSAKCILSSAGSVVAVWLRRTRLWLTVLDSLIDHKRVLIATAVDGPPLCARTGPFVLALGNEGAGLSSQVRSRAHEIMSIPINTKRAESLNVSIAGALCMYGLSPREFRQA